MLLNLFGTLRNTGVPCTLREFLDLLAGLEKQLAFANSEDFYYLSRATLVKDEKHYDKFDRAFDIYFKGLETLGTTNLDGTRTLPCCAPYSPSANSTTGAAQGRKPPKRPNGALCA